MERIVILGAGFGGLAVAEELDPLMGTGKVDVTLVDRNPTFHMGFSMQWVLAGRRRPEEGERPYSSLTMRNVKFVHDEVAAINTADRLVHLKSRRLPYDRLVLALGAELAPQLVRGLAEGGYNLCNLDAVLQLRATLQAVDHGSVLVAVASLPFKCPPVPYEWAFLVDDILRDRKVREKVRIVLTTPEPRPLPLAGRDIGDRVKAILDERGIEYYPNHKPKAVDVTRRTVAYENGAELEYSVLGAVPPHRVPSVVRDAGLADASGFVPADLMTMATSVPGVFAIGDIAGLKLPNGAPHPKAGVCAENQGLVLARRLVAEMGGTPARPYEGKGVCYIEVGGDQAAPMIVDLLAPGGPKAELESPSSPGLTLKRQFERERLFRWFGG